MKRFSLRRRPNGLMTKNFMTSRVLHAAGVVAVVGALASAQQGPLPDVSQFGPKVGDAVPDFSLVDQFDERHDLQSAMGPNGLLLVFNRSASW